MSHLTKTNSRISSYYDKIVVWFILLFLQSSTCTNFIVKESCRLEQGSAILLDTKSDIFIECASLCDRHPNCVAFEYSEGMSSEGRCRLSGKYVNDTSCTVDNLHDGDTVIHELVSINRSQILLNYHQLYARLMKVKMSFSPHEKML